MDYSSPTVALSSDEKTITFTRSESSGCLMSPASATIEGDILTIAMVWVDDDPRYGDPRVCVADAISRSDRLPAPPVPDGPVKVVVTLPQDGPLELGLLRS